MVIKRANTKNIPIFKTRNSQVNEIKSYPASPNTMTLTRGAFFAVSPLDIAFDGLVTGERTVKISCKAWEESKVISNLALFRIMIMLTKGFQSPCGSPDSNIIKFAINRSCTSRNPLDVTHEASS